MKKNLIMLVRLRKAVMVSIGIQLVMLVTLGVWDSLNAAVLVMSILSSLVTVIISVKDLNVNRDSRNIIKKMYEVDNRVQHNLATNQEALQKFYDWVGIKEA
ncbi:hypothetical protein ACWN8V_07485 [Vagococcus elongatus]|uniref:SMODS and SLOG-associating 2TM effector domain-containing protein n=1 Tax=Vagococcus elongatus TaxID=180344 RepID=A0A430AU66_9ENTE|nr:hypothetical protein [Vagococcus elongatus]RSU11595.1 hypothetical protein CBF29_07920 [Vagococcus elongatus]